MSDRGHLTAHGAGLFAARMTERYAEPFMEPDERMTWCVREYVYGPDRYSRQIVSWHDSRADAKRAIAEWKSCHERGYRRGWSARGLRRRVARLNAGTLSRERFNAIKDRYRALTGEKQDV